MPQSAKPGLMLTLTRRRFCPTDLRANKCSKVGGKLRCIELLERWSTLTFMYHVFRLLRRPSAVKPKSVGDTENAPAESERLLGGDGVGRASVRSNSASDLRSSLKAVVAA